MNFPVFESIPTTLKDWALKLTKYITYVEDIPTKGIEGTILKFGGDNEGMIIVRNTEQGQDTSYIDICGGGDNSKRRGSRVIVVGNNRPSTAGNLYLDIGDVTSARGYIRKNDTVIVTINSDGVVFAQPVTVPHDAFDSGWDGLNEAPTKDAIWDSFSYGEATPTVTNVANVTSSSPNSAHWTKQGAFITVYGRLTFDPTAAGYCQLDLTLPVSTNNFASFDQANGLCIGERGGATVGNLGIYGISGTQKVRVAGYVTYTDNTNHYYTYRYKLV
jgi:hypothetical protein